MQSDLKDFSFFSAKEVEDAAKAVSVKAGTVCTSIVKRVCANRNLREGRSITGRLTSSIFCKRTVRLFFSSVLFERELHTSIFY